MRRLNSSSAGFEGALAELTAWLDRIAPDYAPGTDTARLLEMGAGAAVITLGFAAMPVFFYLAR